MAGLINGSVLAVFVPTFLFVSLTPGMCMTLSMTMGMTIGVRRTLPMMWGELVGVGLVAVAAVIGVATIMLKYPALFMVLKWAGGGYLFYLGVQMWLSRGKMAMGAGDGQTMDAPGRELALQGFVTAVANPKGWAFMVSLLPPFILADRPLAPQLAALLTVILVIEFASLVLYASGGSTLRRFLQRQANVRLINRIAGTLMMGVGVWLATG